MLKPIGVRVNLSYTNHYGVPLERHRYPTFVDFSHIYFAEDVDDDVLSETLNDILHGVDMPNGVNVSWEAVDAVDELKGH